MLCKYKIIYILILSLISILNELNCLKCFNCFSSTSNENLNCHISQNSLKYQKECPDNLNACFHSFYTGFNPIDGKKIFNIVRQCVKTNVLGCYIKNKNNLKGYSCFCNEDGCNKNLSSLENF